MLVFTEITVSEADAGGRAPTPPGQLLQVGENTMLPQRGLDGLQDKWAI